MSSCAILRSACGSQCFFSVQALTQGLDFSCDMLPQQRSDVFVFDLARNMAGFCSLRLPPAPSGTTVSLVHAEILDDSGRVHNTFGASEPPRTCRVDVINCADQIDQFVYGTDHEDGDIFTPTFTFHGFRYVGVTGWPAGSPGPDVGALTCHQAHSDMAIAGKVSFNSSTLNAIQAAIVQVWFSFRRFVVARMRGHLWSLCIDACVQV